MLGLRRAGTSIKAELVLAKEGLCKTVARFESQLKFKAEMLRGMLDDERETGHAHAFTLLWVMLRRIRLVQAHSSYAGMLA